MTKQQAVEVEIKSLLGSKTKAQELINKLYKTDQKISKINQSHQLNHYFLPGNFPLLLKHITQHLDAKEVAKLTQIIRQGRNHSTRTRRKNKEVILVVKATVDDTTSANGTARLEYEVSMANFTIEKIDQLLLESKFSYEAKWSRQREEYRYKDMIVSIDKNAGYGYLAEFEKVVTDRALAPSAKKELLGMMKNFEVEELPQNRLERMFSHYNENWRDYYGTDRIFNIA